MEFFNIFLKKDDTEFSISPVKQFGFEIDEFSRVYGRMVITGHVVFKANKNYRSKDQFENFIKENTVNIPTVIMLFEEENYVISKMKNVNNMFINKFDSIKEKYMGEGSIKMFGYVKQPKPRKNGKPGRAYKIQRKERFFIPITRLIYQDDDNSFKYCSPLTIRCTFRQKLI
jgi:hypothetical protein